jgi:hypothetical protein
MKNFNDIIENRTHDLPACSAVPQPAAPQRARYIMVLIKYYISIALRIFSGLSKDRIYFYSSLPVQSIFFVLDTNAPGLLVRFLITVVRCKPESVIMCIF